MVESAWKRYGQSNKIMAQVVRFEYKYISFACSNTSLCVFLKLYVNFVSMSMLQTTMTHTQRKPVSIHKMWELIRERECDALQGKNKLCSNDNGVKVGVSKRHQQMSYSAPIEITNHCTDKDNEVNWVLVTSAHNVRLWVSTLTILWSQICLGRVWDVYQTRACGRLSEIDTHYLLT